MPTFVCSKTHISELFCCFVNVHKLDFLFRILLKLVLLLGKRVRIY